MLENLKEKTGKTLEEWTELLNPMGFEKHGQIVKYLKSEHGVTHGFANTIALKVREADAGSIDDRELVKAQYQGKEQLIPIQEKLEEFIKSLGPDIEIAPKKANISYRRKTQFALIQPSTKSRIDLGLKIKGQENEGKLEGSGPFGSMCTHRIQLKDAADVDQEAFDWVKLAYDNAG